MFFFCFLLQICNSPMGPKPWRDLGRKGNLCLLHWFCHGTHSIVPRSHAPHSHVGKFPQKERWCRTKTFRTRNLGLHFKKETFGIMWMSHLKGYKRECGRASFFAGVYSSVVDLLQVGTSCPPPEVVAGLWDLVKSVNEVNR